MAQRLNFLAIVAYLLKKHLSFIYFYYCYLSLNNKISDLNFIFITFITYLIINHIYINFPSLFFISFSVQRHFTIHILPIIYLSVVCFSTLATALLTDFLLLLFYSSLVFPLTKKVKF